MELKQKILIVEDETRIADFIAATLQNAGYAVLMAATGKAAESLFTSCCPDLMLLDLGLPDLDGLELIRRARGWSQIPIVVVSARTMEKDKVDALDAGADDYLTKPFGTGELLARIRTALRHPGPNPTIWNWRSGGSTAPGGWSSTITGGRSV